jgi:hypothetical protein
MKIASVVSARVSCLQMNLLISINLQHIIDLRVSYNIKIPCNINFELTPCVGYSIRIIIALWCKLRVAVSLCLVGKENCILYEIY